jgi:hypothetical protein
MAYSNSDPDKLHPLGMFVVERLWPFESDVSPLTSSSILPSQGAYAIQTKAGKLESLRLYIPPNDSFRHEYYSMRGDLEGIDLVDDPEEAHLKVFTRLEGRLTFMHTDKRVTRYGMDLMRDGVVSDPVFVEGILETAAHYFRELSRTTASHEIADLVQVEFYKLDSIFRVAGRPTLELLEPVGPNLCRNGVVDFVVSDIDTPYGFKIINNASVDLYVNAFYFDNTSLQIGECRRSLPSARIPFDYLR